MNNQSLYQKTVDILLDAYNNKTLQRRNCFACAVGNIIAANQGHKVVLCEESVRKGYLQNIKWEGFRGYGQDISDVSKLWIQAFHHGKLRGKNITPYIKEQIESTGYTFAEIAKIEDAFEKGKTMLEGLHNVIVTLGKIHEVKEETTIQNQKLFTNEKLVVNC